MDPQQFRIPKQNDQSLLEALVAIRDGMRGTAELTLRIFPHAHASSPVELSGEGSSLFEPVDYVLSEASELMPTLQLFDKARGQQVALDVKRLNEGITDQAQVNWNGWGSSFPPNQGSKAYVKLASLARKHLQAPNVEANLSATGDNEWTRYRDSQQLILSSLQETGKSMLVDFNRKSVEAEAGLRSRFDTLESKLRNELESRTKELDTTHAKRTADLDSREAELEKRAKSFNTKEARYVVRQERQKQLDQIQKWIEGWNLTKGTTTKRWPVGIGYSIALIATGILTVLFSYQNVEILKSKNLSEIALWQWALLSIKSILPLVAFTTFIVYLIRWSAAWARLHSDEELRNRARALDIGRSMWLLEAVRDAQDNQKELPSDLVKELSKNLFSQNVGVDSSDPQAMTELLMQGLSSIRIKSSDGSEVEASRGKRG